MKETGLLGQSAFQRRSGPERERGEARVLREGRGTAKKLTQTQASQLFMPCTWSSAAAVAAAASTAGIGFRCTMKYNKFQALRHAASAQPPPRRYARSLVSSAFPIFTETKRRAACLPVWADTTCFSA